jgi:hypothetical protein
MKAFTLAAALLASAATAAAQTVPAPPRSDVHFVAGWQNLHEPQPQGTYNNWINDMAFGGAGAGWYWNDHLKTQVDLSAATRGRQYRYSQVTTGSSQTLEISRLSIDRRSLAVGQQYQFFRNQWFHPHVGAGLDFGFETRREEYEPTVIYDTVTRVSRLIPGRTEGPEHRLVVRPFVETGFKAYMTRRAFFLSDARLTFSREIDQAVFRFGFGVDF